MPGFCRDCRRDVPDGSGRCSGCGSPRLLCHSELETLAIAHVDCDAFYASIEKRDDPSLKDKPVIVGGGARGVVLTACYVARTFGIKSAMPMFEARRLCPHATIVSPRMDESARIGREVRAPDELLTPIVEPVSIDEAFMDLSGTSRLHGTNAAKALSRFAHEVENDLGITVSIGLSCNKFLAKIASDLDKPGGFAVLGREEASAFLAPKSVTWIFGVGKIAQQRLARDGVRTIGDLQRLGERELMRRYGAEGRRLARLSHGIDDRCVQEQRETKSISAETTFERDLADFRPLELHLQLCESLLTAQAQRACRLDRDAKLKTADFRLRTRAQSLAHPTQLAGRIFGVGRDLCNQADGTMFRLIGIGMCHRSAPQTERAG
jgi:DNA polymerase-4